MMLNETITAITSIDVPEIVINQQSGQACYEWCALQHLTFMNNINVIAAIFVTVALLILILHGILDNIDITRGKVNFLISIAKVFLYLFFFMWIFVIRLRLYWVVAN